MNSNTVKMATSGIHCAYAFYITFIAILYHLGHVTGYSYTGERSIRASVVRTIAYDRMARPNTTTTAYVGFSLLVINDVDIDHHKFVCTGWFTMLWNDDRLNWDPNGYDDTYYIHALEEEIWKPEVLIVNANEDVGLISDDHLIYRIQYNGDVEWEPLMTYKVYCNIDATFFPFDRQECKLELTSWGLPQTELRLKKLWDNVKLDSYRENGSWDIESISVEEASITDYVNGTAEAFSQLNVIFRIRRKPGNYVVTVLVPILFTSYLLSISFLIPVASGERMTSCFLALAVNVLFLTINLEHIPNIEITTSILGVYVCLGFCGDVLCVVLTTLLVKLHHQNENVVIGRIHWLFVIVLKYLTCFRDPPPPPDKELEMLKIPTDDLRKIERTTSPSPSGRNSVSPYFEDGFTEHVRVREDTLPDFDSLLIRAKSAQLPRNGKLEKIIPKKKDQCSNKRRKMTMATAVLIWDRFLFVLFVGVKTAYNVILISNYVSDF